jgi:hypothetical protein
MPKMVWTRMRPLSVAVDAEFAQHDDDRVDHHLVRDEGAENQNGEEDIGALEAPVGERVAVHRGDGDRDEDRRHRDLTEFQKPIDRPSQLRPVQA